MKHNRGVLLAALILSLIVTTTIAGCGGAKAGAKRQVYSASFGKIEVTLAVPAETNSTTSVIEKIDRYFQSLIDKIAVPRTLASYKVDNGSSRPTLCDDYSCGLTLGDGSATHYVNTKEVLGNELKNLSNQQDGDLLSQGTSVLNRLQNTNEVKQGHSGTAYCYFDTHQPWSVAKRITVTSKETHETRVMAKQ